MPDKSFIVASIMSVVMLAVAITCLLELKSLIPLIRFPLQPTIFFIECAYYAVMIHLIIFGLSTWLFTSNIHETRYQTRIFMLVVLLSYWILLLVGYLSPSYREQFSNDDEKIMHFEKEIYDNESIDNFGIGYQFYLLLSCIILLLAVIIWNTVKPPARRPSDVLPSEMEAMQRPSRNSNKSATAAPKPFWTRLINKLMGKK